MSRDPMSCTLKDCERRKKTHVDLLCPSHWGLLPRALKVAFWNASKIRSEFEKAVAIMGAAEDILTWLEKNVKVALPPEVKILTAESEIEKPKDNTPRILTP
jgi:hypothetical protein